MYWLAIAYCHLGLINALSEHLRPVYFISTLTRTSVCDFLVKMRRNQDVKLKLFYDSSFRTQGVRSQGGGDGECLLFRNGDFIRSEDAEDKDCGRCVPLPFTENSMLLC
jgi:hypothetical protein